MARFANSVYFTPASAGTVDFVVSAAVQGFMAPALASVQTGTYKYRAESADLTQWEIGEGTYTSGTVTLTRATVLYNSAGTGTAAGQSGAGTKINFTVAPNVGIVQMVEDTLGIDQANAFSTSQKSQAQTNLGVREVLTAARTYYVRTDGSDSNTGLVNNAGGAFLTVQKAIDVVSGSIDMASFQVTVQVNNGTYTGQMVLKNWVGSLRPIIQGDNTTPANVLISTVGLCVNSDGSMAWTVQGFRLTSSGGGCIHASNAGAVYFGTCDIHTANDVQIWAKSASTISCIANYNITGNSASGIHVAAADGAVFYNPSGTITIPSAIACGTAFALATRNGTLYNTGTITGAGVAGSTGPRYNGNLNGVIYVGGAGANYFPGNAAGSTATGAQYA